MIVRVIAVLGAALAIGVAGGCGDEDSGATGAGNGGDTGQEQTGNSGSAGADGGNGKGAEITTSSLSRDQFVKLGNAACQRESKDYATEVTALLEEGTRKQGGNESREDEIEAELEFGLEATKKVTLPIMAAQIAAVQGLGAPDGDEGEVEAALAAQQRGVEEVEGLEDIGPEDDLGSYFEEGNEMLREYGLKDCAFGG